MNFNRILKKKKKNSFFLQTEQEIPSFSSGDAMKKPTKRIFFKILYRNKRNWKKYRKFNMQNL